MLLELALRAVSFPITDHDSEFSFHQSLALLFWSCFIRIWPETIDDLAALFGHVKYLGRELGLIWLKAIAGLNIVAPFAGYVLSSCRSDQAHAELYLFSLNYLFRTIDRLQCQKLFLPGFDLQDNHRDK